MSAQEPMLGNIIEESSGNIDQLPMNGGVKTTPLNPPPSLTPAPTPSGVKKPVYPSKTALLQKAKLNEEYIPTEQRTRKKHVISEERMTYLKSPEHVAKLQQGRLRAYNLKMAEKGLPTVEVVPPTKTVVAARIAAEKRVEREKEDEKLLDDLREKEYKRLLYERELLRERETHEPRETRVKKQKIVYISDSDTDSDSEHETIYKKKKVSHRSTKPTPSEPINIPKKSKLQLQKESFLAGILNN